MSSLSGETHSAWPAFDGYEAAQYVDSAPEYTDTLLAMTLVLVADILISLDQVRLNAAELRVTPGSELLRVMIHGVLHLCGQDDVTLELETEMHHAEDRALAQLPERVWRAIPASEAWMSECPVSEGKE